MIELSSQEMCDWANANMERVEELERRLKAKDERIKELETRLREEIVSSYDSLTSVRQARYSSPEEYADAVLRAEAKENDT